MSKFTNLDHTYMKMAIELAKKADGQTRPNPLVGAVIVKDNKVIGRGYHHKAGLAHAEIEALKNCKSSVSGATMYVTLEPCCHTNKRTAPCVNEVIKSGIKKIYIAQIDPNPNVSGKGVLALKKAGIKVEAGLMKTEVRKMNLIFEKNITTSLPYMTSKVGLSLDGNYALKSGESKWITNQKARNFVYKLRSEYDAILTTSSTVIADDPNLGTHGLKYEPLRIVVDRSLKTDLSKQVYRDNNVIVLTSSRNSKKIEIFNKNGIKVLIYSSDDFLIRAFKDLYKLGVCNIFVEAGGKFNSHLLKKGLLDKLYLIYGNKILGDGERIFNDFKISKLANSPELIDLEMISLDDNFCITGNLKK